MVVTRCLECGAEKVSYPSQVRKFCSLSCRARYKARLGMPSKPRRGVEKPCQHCGTPLYRSAGQTDKRFCSRECLAASQRTSITKTCPRCGDSFTTQPSTNLSYCGRACYEAARTQKSSTGRMHNGRLAIRDHAGYIRIWQPDHPRASQGRILEHRWVVEQTLGRVLDTDEVVHHLNGVKDDNRLENLAVMSAQDHRLLTAAEMKEQRDSDWAELAEYRRRFGPLPPL